MSDQPISLSTSGLPETVLPDPPAEVAHVLLAGGTADDLAAVATRHPREPGAWAALGDALVAEQQGSAPRAPARAQAEAYAAYRVGYHRGLDQLRANGWRGSGYVRWQHPSNRGFLRALDGLRSVAAEIGEVDEAARCDEFLHQLDPGWDRRGD